MNVVVQCQPPSILFPDSQTKSAQSNGLCVLVDLPQYVDLGASPEATGGE